MKIIYFEFNYIFVNDLLQNHAESRAIVFCEYRESVLLIYRMLLQHVPLLKPKCFVGKYELHLDGNGN